MNFQLVCKKYYFLRTAAGTVHLVERSTGVYGDFRPILVKYRDAQYALRPFDDLCFGHGQHQGNVALDRDGAIVRAAVGLLVSAMGLSSVYRICGRSTDGYVAVVRSYRHRDESGPVQRRFFYENRHIEAHSGITSFGAVGRSAVPFHCGR